jgi:hypothetical protein
MELILQVLDDLRVAGGSANFPFLVNKLILEIEDQQAQDTPFASALGRLLRAQFFMCRSQTMQLQIFDLLTSKKMFLKNQELLSGFAARIERSFDFIFFGKTDPQLQTKVLLFLMCEFPALFTALATRMASQTPSAVPFFWEFCFQHKWPSLATLIQTLTPFLTAAPLGESELLEVLSVFNLPDFPTEHLPPDAQQLLFFQSCLLLKHFDVYYKKVVLDFIHGLKPEFLRKHLKSMITSTKYSKGVTGSPLDFAFNVDGSLLNCMEAELPFIRHLCLLILKKLSQQVDTATYLHISTLLFYFYNDEDLLIRIEALELDHRIRSRLAKRNIYLNEGEIRNKVFHYAALVQDGNERVRKVALKILSKMRISNISNADVFFKLLQAFGAAVAPQLASGSVPPYLRGFLAKFLETNKALGQLLVKHQWELFRPIREGTVDPQELSEWPKSIALTSFLLENKDDWLLQTKVSAKRLMQTQFYLHSLGKSKPTTPVSQLTLQPTTSKLTNTLLDDLRRIQTGVNKQDSIAPPSVPKKDTWFWIESIAHDFTGEKVVGFLQKCQILLENIVIPKLSRSKDQSSLQSLAAVVPKSLLLRMVFLFVEAKFSSEFARKTIRDLTKCALIIAKLCSLDLVGTHFTYCSSEVLTELQNEAGYLVSVNRHLVFLKEKAIAIFPSGWRFQLDPTTYKCKLERVELSEEASESTFGWGVKPPTLHIKVSFLKKIRKNHADYSMELTFASREVAVKPVDDFQSLYVRMKKFTLIPTDSRGKIVGFRLLKHVGSQFYFPVSNFLWVA